MSAALNLIKKPDFDFIIQHCPVMLWHAGVDNRISWVNDIYIDYTGSRLEQLVGTGWANHVHQDDLDNCYKSYLDAFFAKQPYEQRFRFRRNDGEFRWVQAWGAPQFVNNDFVGFLGGLRDIHEQHVQQERQRKSEETLSKIFEDAAVGMVQTDIDGRILKTNIKFCAILGLRRAEIEMQPLDKFVHRDDIQKRQEGIKQLTSGKIPYFEDERRLVHRTGDIVTVLLRASPIKNWLGHVVALNMQVIDITAKVQLERALREANVRFQLALAARNMGVWEWDVLRDVMAWDDTLVRLYQIRREHFQNSHRAWEGFIHADDRARFRKEVDAAKLQGENFESCYRVTTGEERVRYMRSAAMIERAADGQPIRFVGLTWDVTEEIEQSSDLDRQRSLASNASKMAALGEMAAGMAHEINNPLAIIMGKVQQIENMVQDKNHSEKTILEETAKIQLTVNRIAAVIRGLRSFARDDRRDPKAVIQVSDLIADTLSLCQARFKDAGVRLEVPEIATIKFECHPSQISQILLNLLNNAFDAIATQADKWIRLEVFPIKGELVFRVTDSGPGVPADVAAKIFHPFFTTKPAGKGIGLGLSISKGLVENHGGKLVLLSASSPTVFEARFPHRRAHEI